MLKTILHQGDVVQISPDRPDKLFAGCFMTVTEPKDWGAQGYIKLHGTGGEPGGQAYARIGWEDMELVGHCAFYTP